MEQDAAVEAIEIILKAVALMRERIEEMAVAMVAWAGRKDLKVIRN